MAGWVVTASGNAETPDAHKNLLEKLRSLLGEEEFQTGSSYFNSPHAEQANFHVPGTATLADPQDGGDAGVPQTPPAAPEPGGGPQSPEDDAATGSVEPPQG